MSTEVDYQAMMAHQGNLVGYQDMEPAFFPILERCRRYTMTSVERMYDLYKSVEYVIEANVPGAFVECGVWRGGSLMVVAMTLVKLGVTDREILMFDTFAGHTEPPSVSMDVGILGDNAFETWQQFQAAGEPWCAVPVDEVMRNLESTCYAGPITPFVGPVESLLPSSNMPISGRALALLRLDMDWYAPTVVALNHLYPLLSRGGVLIVDDWGHYRGQRFACEEYFSTQPIMLHRIDYSARSGIKP